MPKLIIHSKYTDQLERYQYVKVKNETYYPHPLPIAKLSPLSRAHLLETSTCIEWSITRSAGQTGLIFSGSPPRRCTASLIAAKSTTAGTPLKVKDFLLNNLLFFVFVSNSFGYFQEKKLDTHFFQLSFKTKLEYKMITNIHSPYCTRINSLSFFQQQSECSI